jgi:hypothetical protein
VSTPSKRSGTTAEVGAEKYLNARGVPTVRQVLRGKHDQGDLHIFGGTIVAEVKSRRTWHSPADIERWMAELERECMNVPQCSVGVLVVKRPGSGPANAGDWLCYLRADEWLALSRWRHPQPWLMAAAPDLAAEWVCVNLAHLASALLALPPGAAA